jgi:hypothetical protein
VFGRRRGIPERTIGGGIRWCQTERKGCGGQWGEEWGTGTLKVGSLMRQGLGGGGRQKD